MLLDKMTLIYGVPISKNTNSFCPEKAKHNIAFKSWSLLLCRILITIVTSYEKQTFNFPNVNWIQFNILCLPLDNFDILSLIFPRK